MWLLYQRVTRSDNEERKQIFVSSEDTRKTRITGGVLDYARKTAPRSQAIHSDQPTQTTAPRGNTERSGVSKKPP